MEDLIKLRDLVEDDSYMSSMDNVEGLSFFVDKTKVDQGLLCRLLNETASMSDSQIMDILISIGPNVEYLLPIFTTAVKKFNNFSVIRKILDAGLDVNDIIDSHLTAIIQNQTPECIEYILGLGVRYKVDFHAKFILKWLLDTGDDNSHLEKLEVLLKYGFIKYFDKELIRDSRIANFEMRQLICHYGGLIMTARMLVGRFTS